MRVAPPPVRTSPVAAQTVCGADGETSIAATGPTDDTGRFPMVLKNLTGVKIKLVQGYPGGNNVTQAMEAGEVDGRFGWS